jgi:exodeoxyribonuclease VII small subunit
MWAGSSLHFARQCLSSSRDQRALSIHPRRMSFEEKLRRLEQILASLEEDQIGLDASLKLFEEGIEILRSASTELGRAETKVQMLLEKADGGFELREMDL